MSGNPGAVQLRYDRVDDWGKISMRRAGRMHHLGVGYAHRGTRAVAIADNTTVTVTQLETGEILCTHLIEPAKSYWRNTQRAPRPMAGSPMTVTHVATQVSPMSRLITWGS